MFPTQPDRAAGTQPEQADLEKLAAELGIRGCKTVLTAGEGRQPRLDVLNPQASMLTGRIYAQADYFWWSTAELIAARDQIPTAASTIARALATTPVSGPG